MNRIRTTIFISAVIALSFSCFFSSCKGKKLDGMIIFTACGKNVQDIGSSSMDSNRFAFQTSIMAFNPENPGTPAKPLTDAFYSARSPEISYDGTHLLFIAKQNQNDPWQIWEMNLKSSKTRRLLTSTENLIDPAYLPSGRIIFSKLTINDTKQNGNAIYTCKNDGSDIRQITFNPNAYTSSTILKDGRVLTLSSQLYPEKKDAIFMVLRPDGTKAGLFYKGPEGSEVVSRGRETADGKIVFLECGKTNPERINVVSVDYKRPLHSHINLTSDIPGNFLSVFPMHSGRLLVSYRKSSSERYALNDFDPLKKIAGEVIYGNKDFDILEAVIVEKNQKPRNLPSEVDMGVKTGLMLCQDINFCGLPSSAETAEMGKAFKIKIVGRDSTLGVVQVEEDGSFYLKVTADTPFRLERIDNKGNALNGSCSWIWVRPNERRGCIGCHEDPELVPDNRVPLAVKISPVNVPVHINTIVEKKVSLE